ncbi:hypothetical protein THAOC_17202, partial [Thalassiosira oceanica]
ARGRDIPADWCLQETIASGPVTLLDSAAMEDEVAIMVQGVCPVPMGIGRKDRCFWIAQIWAEQGGAAMEDEVAIRVQGVCPVPMGIGRKDRCFNPKPPKRNNKHELAPSKLTQGGWAGKIKYHWAKELRTPAQCRRSPSFFSSSNIELLFQCINLVLSDCGGWTQPVQPK